jgi:hypothetical protein
MVRPLDVINQIMQSNGLAPAAAMSTAAGQPYYDQDCTSAYGDSALVLNAFELLSAMTGGGFGATPLNSNGTSCGTAIDPSDYKMIPSSAYLPTVIDVHTYPADAVFDTGWSWIGDPNFSGCQYYPDGAPITNVWAYTNYNGTLAWQWSPNCSNNDFDPSNLPASSQKAATIIYQAIANFIQRWNQDFPAGAPVIIGETDEYNPGFTEGNKITTLSDTAVDPGTGVAHAVNFWGTPDWAWHRPWSSVSAGENVAGLAASSLAASNVILRPWEPVAWGTVLSPSPLSGSPGTPYNVGACTYTLSVAGNLNIPPSGGAFPVNINNAQNSQNCVWSTAPTPPSTSTGSNPAYPAWFTSTPVTWQRGSGTASFTFAANSSPSPRTFQVTVAGSGVTVTQAGGLTAPALSSPGNGATASLSPTLTWSAGANATGYQVYFGAHTNPPLLTTLPGSATSFTVGPLAYNTTYYWSVTATDAFGDSSSSPIFSFTPALMAGSKVGLVRQNVFDFDSDGNESGPAPVDPADRIDAFAPPGGVLAGDQPVTGDWTGDGLSKAGWFRPSTGQWWLDAANTGVYSAGASYTYQFAGGPNDVAVAGDWAGLGKSAIGVVRNGFLWILDLNADGIFEAPAGSPTVGDAVFAFGAPGDVPVVGNWNGKTSAAGFAMFQAGMVRTYCNPTCTGGPFLWLLDNGTAGTVTGGVGSPGTLSGGVTGAHAVGNLPGMAFGGGTGDVPVTGDWNNTGVWQFGDFRSGFLWVLDGATPLTPQAGHFVGFSFAYGGIAGDVPIVGKW